jgi:hypothetical protein
MYLGGPDLLDQPARLHKLVESMPWNRFLGSLNVYKFGSGWEEVGIAAAPTTPQHYFSFNSMILPSIHSSYDPI